MAGIAIIVTASAAGLLDLLPGGSLTLGLAGLGGGAGLYFGVSPDRSTSGC